MSQSIPIVFSELFQLTNLPGISPNTITFSTVSMQSDKYICVRDTISETKLINIVEVESQKLTTNKINAESAIMNPSAKVLALRGMS